ncbi:MAG: TraB/GumN family protein [Bacteroidota bacterium]
MIKYQSFMKKLSRIALLLAVGFVVGTGLANVAKAQKGKSSLLWEISGNGLESSSYLYGTIHMICVDDFVMNDQIKQAFEKTELTVLEIDMDDSVALKTEGTKYSVNPGMTNFSAEIDEKDKEVINAFFQEHYKVDLTQLGILKPFALMSMVLPKMATCPVKSYEEAFVNYSQEAKKEVVGLETVKFQMTLFDEVPMEKQVSWLVETIEDMDSQSEEFSKMTKAYTSNDLDGLFSVMTDSPQFRDFEDLMLYDRNRDWISKIEDIIKEQPAFIAVGAGHLASDQGVVELLKKAGYKVKPIKF